MRRVALVLPLVGTFAVFGFMAFFAYVLAIEPDIERRDSETIEGLFLGAWLLSVALLLLYATMVIRNPSLTGPKVGRGGWILLLIIFGPAAQLAYWLKYLRPQLATKDS